MAFASLLGFVGSSPTLAIGFNFKKERNKMSNERHYYLYAKGWYQQSDLLTDLKKVQSVYCGADPGHITIEDILSTLTGLVYSKLKKSEHAFNDFISLILPSNTWRTGVVLVENVVGSIPDEDIALCIIGACLNIMMKENVNDIPFDLGEPDPNVLPLREIK